MNRICLDENLRGEPFQDLLSVHEISIENYRRHAPEINESRGVVDVVLPRRVRVVVLDKVDAVRVRFVVDLLQAFQDGVTLNALIIV